MTPVQYHLVIFGGQGSGKGTQAKTLADKFGLITLGLGDILRQLAEEQTPMGQRVRKIVEAGELVPDEITDQIVALKLGEIPPNFGFILDGYPRNLAQARALRKTLAGLGRLEPKPVFINLRVPRSELLVRLRKRRYTEGRYDDTEEGITQRLKIYDEHTKPVLEAVHDWADVLPINGDQPIPKVAAKIQAKLKELDG